MKFAVQPAGRAKVLAEKQKNVHAYVRGYLVDVFMPEPEDSFIKSDKWVLVTYNPYLYDSFVIKSDPSIKVTTAEEVVMFGKNIYALLKENISCPNP